MGSYLMSESTGIIFNNEMNDFSIPSAVSDGLLPAPGNFIVPGKSPMSSMNPIIVVDKQGEVTMVSGGAGGVLIMTSLIQTLLNYFYLNKPIKEAINSLRLHHQLQPMRVRYEFGYDPEIVKFLASKDHEMYEQAPMYTGFAAVVALVKKDGKIDGAIDSRRGGRVIVFD
jgi:gamma-glutamyltranspeptidase / glutathione hydrolase / leukotriene-C4 hydrolase